MAKYIFHVSTNVKNSTIEEVFDIPDVKLEGLTEEEEEKVVEKYFIEWKADHINGNWESLDRKKIIYLSPSELTQKGFKMPYLNQSARYIYYIRYEVAIEDQPGTSFENFYISSDEKLNMRELYESVLNDWEDRIEYKSEESKAKMLIESSIKLKYALDQQNKNNDT
ncbi:DUF7167 family protein [Chengkuizengella marina]|uniref:DUF7167 domain-containing protein n=1 Tax=Chengkuizengella marina TaxID=2507566 RepID=A0A6N9Q0E3_9BACL|nr:hypothetical protein [Chengkuizengella marina]NBI28646.1 hypothetical protein [Chengkuizengella marina]